MPCPKQFWPFELISTFQTSLLSFYFLVTGHVNRAWTMIGISLRHAISLGLHLRNTDPTMYESRRNTLTCTWWTAHSIECLLNIITGRPPVISEEYCTVPLPNSLFEKQDSFRVRLSHATRELTDPLPEQFPYDSSDHLPDETVTNRISYINSRIEVLLIMREAQRCLYSPRTATQSWEVSSSHLPVSPGVLPVGLHFCSSYRLGYPTYSIDWRDGTK
jgi:hypothetical protein